MDNKVKSGGLTFTGVLAFIVGIWGTMRDAQDMTVTLLGLNYAEISFLLMLLAIPVFSYGLAWFIGANIGFIQEYRDARRTRLAEQERQGTIALEDAVTQLAYLRDGGNKGDASIRRALAEIEASLRTGDLSLTGVEFQSRIRIPHSIWMRGTVLEVCREDFSRFSIVFKDSEKGRPRYSRLRLNRAEVLKTWPSLGLVDA